MKVPTYRVDRITPSGVFEGEEEFWTNKEAVDEMERLEKDAKRMGDCYSKFAIMRVEEELL